MRTVDLWPQVGVDDGWVVAIIVIETTLSAALRRKLMGASAPAWALHSWSCRHIRPPLPPGVASLLPELSFLQGRARPELPGSLRQICGEPGLCKEGM